MDVNVFLQSGDFTRLAQVLDDLGLEARSWALRHIDRELLPRLFEGLSDAVLTVDELAPGDGDVTYEGAGSMALSHHNARKIRRVSSGGASADVLAVGYHTKGPPGLGTLHFAVMQGPGRGELAFDYDRALPERPEGWPAPASGARPFVELATASVREVVRKVSSHVIVTRLVSERGPLDAWFVLGRTTP